MTGSTITFQEAFRNLRTALVGKLDVSILLLNKLLDFELLTPDNVKQLQAINNRDEAASRLLDVLETREHGFDKFCEALNKVGQQHVVVFLATRRPVDDRNPPTPQRTEHSRKWILITGMFLAALVVPLISIGTHYMYYPDPPKAKPEPPKAKQPLPPTIPLVRQNSETFTESLPHLSVMPDLVPYPYEEIAAHIRDITAKARHILQDLPTKVDVQDLERQVEAYKMFVRPILENRSSAWSPDKKKDIEDIENVQREFVDSVIGTENKMSYKQKLEHLELESLEVRRLRAILMHAYRIAFEVVDVDKEGFFVLTTEKAKGGHNHKLELRGNPAGHLFHFSSTAVFTWNKLPADEVDFNSIEAFEKSLTPNVLLAFCKCKLQ